MEKIKVWVFGLVMLFAFNYVMIYTIKANNAIASFFLTIGNVPASAQPAESPPAENPPPAAPAAQEESVFAPQDPLLKEFFNAWHDSRNNMGGIMGALIYFGAAVMMAWLVVVYVIRMLFITFLIIIFPVVMAVYCIDRLDDNKSAVFQEWWKHFLSHVFTNSIHALTLGIIYTTIIGDKNVPAVIKLLVLFTFFPANKLAREIFGLEKGGAADVGGVAALGAGMMLGKMFGGGKSSSGGGASKESGGDKKEGGGDNGGDGESSLSAYGRFTNLRDNVKEKGYKEAIGKPLKKEAKALAKKFGNDAVRATGKGMGAAMGATAMLATGQSMQTAIAAGYAGSQLTGKATDKAMEAGAGAVGFGMDAKRHHDFKKKFKDQIDMQQHTYANGVAYSDSTGEILKFDEMDNSHLTSNTLDKQVGDRFSEGDDDERKNAAYGLTYSTDSDGNIKNNSIKLEDEQITDKVKHRFQPREDALNTQRAQLSEDVFGKGNKTGFNNYDLTDSKQYNKAREEINRNGTNVSEGLKGLESLRSRDMAFSRDRGDAVKKESATASNHARQVLGKANPMTQQKRLTFNSSDVTNT